MYLCIKFVVVEMYNSINRSCIGIGELLAKAKAGLEGAGKEPAKKEGKKEVFWREEI